MMVIARIVSGFVGRLPLKAIAIAALTLSVTALGYLMYSKIWERGYTAAQVEMQASNLKAIEDAVESAKLGWEQSADILELELEAEREISRGVRNVEERIPRAVERTDSACRDVGGDVLGLFNDAIDAANSRSVRTVP